MLVKQKLNERFFDFENSFYELQHNSEYCDGSGAQIYAPHIHDCYEIYVKVNGEISFMSESTVYQLENYDAVVSAPGEIHNAIVNGSSTHEHYCLWFSGEALKSFADENKLSGAVRLSDSKKKKLARILSECENAGDKLRSTLSILHVLLLLCEREEEIPAVALPEKLCEILGYIDSHLTGIRSSEEIAEHFSLSVSTLNRMFAKNLRTTVHVLIEKKRLYYSKQLLVGGKSVSDACFDSGFSDLSRFISKFKREFGATPLKYKRENALF